MEHKRVINSGDIYRHFKNKLYQVKDIAYHSETGEKYVVYQALYGSFKTYIRPFDMFMSEVDHIKYPDVRQKYRFEKVAVDDDGRIICQEESESENTDIIQSGDDVNDNERDNMEEGSVNPYLIEFLDKDTIKEKIEYINMIKKNVDNRLISDIAATMDLTIDDGELDDRYRQLVNCLQTMARFECNRLR